MNAQLPSRYRQHFCSVLAERFNVSELQGIAYVLGVDYESLPGDEKMGKLRELVKWCERAQRLDDLVAVVAQQRPAVDWPMILQSDDSAGHSVDGMWAMVARHQVTGDVGTALYFLKQIQQIEPDNWRATREIERMNREIAAGLVGDDGLIKPDQVIAVSKVPSLPESFPKAQSQRSKYVIAIGAVIVVLILLVIVAYVLGLFGR